MILALATIREGLSKGHELSYCTDKQAFTTKTEENVSTVTATVAKRLFQFLENNQGAITPDLLYLIRKRCAIEAQQANTFSEIVFGNLQFFFSKPIPFEQGNPIYAQIGRCEKDFPRTIAQNATPHYWAGVVPDPEKWNKYSITFKYKHSAFYWTISLHELPLEALKKRIHEFFLVKRLEEELKRQFVRNNLFQHFRFSLEPTASRDGHRDENAAFNLRLECCVTAYFFKGNDLPKIKEEISIFLKTITSPALAQFLSEFTCRFVRGKPTIQDFDSSVLVYTVHGEDVWTHYREGDKVVAVQLIQSNKLMEDNYYQLRFYLRLVSFCERIPPPYYFDFRWANEESQPLSPYAIGIRKGCDEQVFTLTFPSFGTNEIKIKEYNLAQISEFISDFHEMRVCSVLNKESQFAKQFPIMPMSRCLIHRGITVCYNSGDYVFRFKSSRIEISSLLSNDALKNKVDQWLKRHPKVRLKSIKKMMNKLNIGYGKKTDPVSPVIYEEILLDDALLGWNFTIGRDRKTCLAVMLDTFKENVKQLKRLLYLYVRAAECALMLVVNDEHRTNFVNSQECYAAIDSCADGFFLLVKSVFSDSIRTYTSIAINVGKALVKDISERFYQHLQADVAKARGLLIGKDVLFHESMLEKAGFVLQEQNTQFQLYTLDFSGKMHTERCEKKELLSLAGRYKRRQQLYQTLKQYPPEVHDYVFLESDPSASTLLRDTLYLSTDRECTFLKFSACISPTCEQWKETNYYNETLDLPFLIREYHKLLDALREKEYCVVSGQYSDVAPYIETAFMRYPDLRSSILKLSLPEKALFTKSINDWWRIHRHGDEELQQQLVHLQALIEKKVFIKEPSNVTESVYKRFCEEYERLKSGKGARLGSKEADEHKAAYYRSLDELREGAIASFTENFMEAREELLKKEEFILKAFTDLKYLKGGQATRLGILKLLEHDGYIKRKEKFTN